MIINVRGTSGSGKSTLVREIMGLYEAKAPQFVSGRKRPLGYILSDSSMKLPLAVVGHYETPCGGCDTIPQMERIFELVRWSHNQGYNVLFEGLLISADSKRTLELAKTGYPLRVVALNTPIEVCLSGINDRRVKRMGDDYTPVNPKNTESKHKGVRSSMAKLQANNVDAVWADRERAYEIVKELLRGE